MGIRVAIRVRPGAARAGVGGAYGEALVVKVAARALEGRATEAALRAVAEALGVRRRDVRLLSGATSRNKIVEVDGDARRLTVEIDRLLGS
ncbi:MAG TPA: DUF167 domain-containing protein [Actinomadura sp.]|jgi:hypothetical protein|nr:DUF167 domain-containing protein [Actinomadura sp.]